jgi:ariadne-1
MLKLRCSITRNYFENLVQAMEAGLEDVTATGAAATSSDNATTSKKAGTNVKAAKKQRSGSSDNSDENMAM